jgi:hypothetical protein
MLTEKEKIELNELYYKQYALYKHSRPELPDFEQKVLAERDVLNAIQVRTYGRK